MPLLLQGFLLEYSWRDEREKVHRCNAQCIVPVRTGQVNLQLACGCRTELRPEIAWSPPSARNRRPRLRFDRIGDGMQRFPVMAPGLRAVTHRTAFPLEIFSPGRDWKMRKADPPLADAGGKSPGFAQRRRISGENASVTSPAPTTPCGKWIDRLVEVANPSCTTCLPGWRDAFQGPGTSGPPPGGGWHHPLPRQRPVRQSPTPLRRIWRRQARTRREAHLSAWNGEDEASRNQDRQIGQDFSDGTLVWWNLNK